MTGLTFETERLTLARMNSSDNVFIMKLVNTEGWLKFIGNRNVKTIEDANNYIDKITNHKNTIYWVVKRKNDGLRIGIITLIKRDNLKYFDFGFAFLPDFGKMGYACEASKVVLNRLMLEPQFKTLLAVTITENHNSINLLEKLGFEYLEEMEQNNEKLSVYKIENI